MGAIGLGGMMIGPDAASTISSPIPLSGLTLWLKADKGFLSVADTWVDQSGNGNNFIGYGGANTPTAGTGINGFSTVEFNGTSQGMQTDVSHTLANLSAGITFSIFGVLKYTGTHSKLGNLFTDPIFIDQSGDFGVFPIDAGGNFEIWAATDSHNNTGLVSGAHILGNPQYFSFVQANITGGGNGQHLIVNGDSAILQDGISFAGATASRVNIGHWTGTGANYYTGSIGEIIMYNRAVSGGEETSINNYLKTKFGL